MYAKPETPKSYLLVYATVLKSLPFCIQAREDKIRLEKEAID
jgi:hypothetical protein